MQHFLDYQTCLGLTPIDRLYHIAAQDINPSTGKAYAINPSSGVWDDNYFATHFGNSGNNNNNAPSAPSTQDVIAQAQALRDFNVKNNQPAITSLQGQSTDLQSRYKDLLASIKGQQGVAENQQITATSNELGKRGINNQSGVYQQEQATALRPLDAQYQGLSAQTGVAEQGQLNDIGNAVASLQAGNPESAAALSSGNLNTIYGVQQQAANIAAQNAAQIQINKDTNQYRQIPYGGGLYNTSTNTNVAGGNGGGITPLTTSGGINTGGNNPIPDPASFVFNGGTLNTKQAQSSGGLTFNTPISF